jgi:hypothetical protein
MNFLYRVVLCVLIPLLNCQVVLAEESAQEIFEKATGQLLTDNVELVMELDITDRRGRVKEKEFSVLMASFGETRKTKVTWQKPERAKGTTVIISDAADEDGTIEVFTPSNGKTRKLKATPKNLERVGSEFGMDGMINQNPEELSFRMLEQQVIDSVPCFHIEVKPIDGKDASRGELWIEKASYRIVQVVVFDQDGKQTSLATLSDYKPVDGLTQKSQPMRIVREDFESKKQTDLRVLKIMSREDLNEDDFALTGM